MSKNEYRMLNVEREQFNIGYSILRIFAQSKKYKTDMDIKEMEHMHFPILIEQDEDKYYIVSCPSFKGCHSYGETIDEAMDNIKEVIEICLEEEIAKNQTRNKFIGFREMQIHYDPLAHH